ncbi:hypothetical protein GCM10007052_29950 [Halioglobus japonicus]|uniref:disulfide bond formation protein B n=1 Tax=Halioglobus japonicus TaxID=930805 RepID=UPI0015E0F55B|nr:disulfide bond formation protein B [Halioglobus japonicus]GHD20414.1 hypothetical protein GCM10007052_29950 [Halioglobus japonicus]
MINAVTNHKIRQLNALGLIAIGLTLVYAFSDQLLHGELPCPLCLLQRVAFAAVCIGLMLNVIVGPKPAHYGFSIIAAVAGAAFALRQISLHVIPGTPGYGAPFLGFHFYTWAFVLFTIIVIGLALLSSLPAQYEDSQGPLSWKELPAISKTAVAATLLLIALNAMAAFALCGPGVCPDDPASYWLGRAE